MVREKNNKKPAGNHVKYVFMCLLAILVSIPVLTTASPASAQQSVVLPPMPFTPSKRNYGVHVHPISGKKKMHFGQDYPIPTGTNVPYTGTIISCKPNNGAAGNMVTVGNACGVKQIFMHLRECSGNSIISGNSGGSTGAHLHYEVLINGTKVDPILAADGKSNLCDEEVRKKLLEDAKNNGVGPGGGGASANNNTPEPTAPPVDHVVYVPKGSADPGTGTVNTGGGYYYIESPDGRVRRELEFSSFDVTTPIMPPTTDDVVSVTETDNDITGCATDTWKAMVNQAVMQTRRETAINGRYILKGDTVMAYACLEESLKKVGEHAGPIFSETKRWVNVDIDIMGKTVKVNKELGENSLDGAIMNAANYILITHARTNFKHDLLGGLYETTTGGNEADEDTGQDGLPCGTMAQVWQMAKCLNVSDEPLFPRFEELVEPQSDPRKYPPNMSCNNTGITQKMIDTARQKEVDNSKLVTHLNIIYPTGDCYPPVDTGIKVVRQKGAMQVTQRVTYADGVCISAGCSYQNGGSGAGKCERNP